jgi:gamma-butyrobetaine dioxygenase
MAEFLLADFGIEIGTRKVKVKPFALAKDQKPVPQIPKQSKSHPVVGKLLDRPDPFWLRDACSCELCVDPSSKQKHFQTSDIPLEIDYLSKEVGPDGTLIVTWSNDIPGFGSNHVSTYTNSFLSSYSNNSRVKAEEPYPYRYRECTRWDKAIIKDSVKFVDFNNYMSQDSVLHDVLKQLQVYGLVFLRNIPESEKAIEDIGGRIGPLKNTFYGLTWDVKSVPQAKNVAYTHQYLGLHMDLLYMDNPPALQLLHCLRNTCEGGTSLFCDSYQTAAQLRDDNINSFNRLLYQKTRFVYDNAGENYSKNRHVIKIGKNKEIESVSWSPPFQGPFMISGGNLDSNSASYFRSYTGALKEFAARIEAPENIYEYRLKEGECVIFNNRRVLHARTAFDISSGERWLKGAYIDGDVWSSRHRVLEKIFGPVPTPLSS